MGRGLNRRQILVSSGAFASVMALSARLSAGAAKPAVAPPNFGPPQPFSFDQLTGQAETLSKQPFLPRPVPSHDILDAITYDQYQKIRMRRDRVIDIGGDRRLPMAPFHLGVHAREPVRLHLVENGSARPLAYDADLFDMPADHPARMLQPDAGFAGFRILEPELNSDWFAAMGASYFRTSGPFDQYGISARGLAIDTAMAHGEEFPSFTAFWLEQPRDRADPVVTVYALLDSKSVAGAYRMHIVRARNRTGVRHIAMDIEARLFARQPVGRLGIAPFSSMFWYGEANRSKAVDWRPEIHDSDGLAIWNGAGERLWRPLSNPPRVMTNTFRDKDPKGFGLMQRDREVGHYRDDAVFYERRPSVWVEPREAWGEGEVHLVEIPTNDETFDNIVAYWSPKAQLTPDAPQTWRYRLTWLDDVKLEDGLARSLATWTGVGGRPAFKRPEGVRKFVVDFAGERLRGLDRDAGVSWEITASRGNVSNVYTHPVAGQQARWRAFADLKAGGDEPVDLRGVLVRRGEIISEVWLYQYFPEQD